MVFVLALEVTMQYFAKLVLFLKLQVLLNNHDNDVAIVYAGFLSLGVYLPGQKTVHLLSWLTLLHIYCSILLEINS